MGRIVCAGLGPGDPDLMSVRADRLVRACTSPKANPTRRPAGYTPGPGATPLAAATGVCCHCAGRRHWRNKACMRPLPQGAPPALKNQCAKSAAS